MRRITLIILCVSLFVMAGVHVSAQANTLTNPGMEQPYGGGYLRNTASGWTAWVGNGDADFYPEQYGSVRGGVNSQAIMAIYVFEGQTLYDVAVYQTVTSIPSGSRVRASGWGSIWMTGVPNPAGADAVLSVCVDPNGGTNIYDGDVICSGTNAGTGADDGGGGWLMPYSQNTVETTTTGPSVTFFFRWTQRWGGLEQRAFFDDASLVVLQAGDGTVPDGGDGGDGQNPAPTAVPPPPASSFASPQGEREDGSIVHIVQSGNTIASIAVAYSVPMEDVLALNPDIGDGRFIYVGQEILIRRADSDVDDVEPEATEEEDSASPEPSEAATDDEPPPIATSDDQSDEEEDDPTATKEPVATREPTATPRPTITPSPTPLPDAPVQVADANANPGSGDMTAVCVLLYEDLNMNLIQEQGEGLLAGGTISLKQGESDLNTIMTDTSPDPRCFDGLAAGEYMLVANAPGGYGLTTPARLGIRLQAGETLNMSFGAAQGVQEVAPPPANVEDQEPVAVVQPEDDGTSDSELLQNIGLIVFGLAGMALVGGLGMAFLLRRR